MSKNNIKSIVEFTFEDSERELDSEFAKELSKETEEYNKEYELNNKCINICADIRSYLDHSGLSYDVFNSISVDTIKQFISENY